MHGAQPSSRRFSSGREKKVRRTKMLVAAALTAVTALALIGATSASASKEISTTLCTQPEGGSLTCADGNRATTVHFVDPRAELLSIVDIHCEALLSGNVESPILSAKGTPLGITVTTLKYLKCLRENGSSCSATAETLGLIDVLKTLPNLAEITGLGTEVHVQCGILINCTYGAAALVGHGLSAELPTHAGLVTLHEKTVTSTKGGFCPASAKLDALFQSLTDLYIKS